MHCAGDTLVIPEQFIGCVLPTVLGERLRKLEPIIILLSIVTLQTGSALVIAFDLRRTCMNDEGIFG